MFPPEYLLITVGAYLSYILLWQHHHWSHTGGSISYMSLISDWFRELFPYTIVHVYTSNRCLSIPRQEDPSGLT